LSPPLSARRERVGVTGKCHAEVLFYRGKYCEVHCLRITRCVDQHAAGGVFRRDFTKTLAQSLMEIEIEPLEPICRGSCRGSGETGLDRQIEDQCQIWRKIAEGKALQCRELFESHSLAIPLVGQRRIGKSIRNNPYALRKGGSDKAVDVITPR